MRDPCIYPARSLVSAMLCVLCFWGIVLVAIWSAFHD